MPYIKKNDRNEYDPQILGLAEKIREMTRSEGRAGHMNYTITRLILAVYGEKLRYADHNEVVGMLECAKQEFYRRATAPYEDEKITSEGDVY